MTPCILSGVAIIYPFEIRQGVSEAPSLVRHPKDLEDFNAEHFQLTTSRTERLCHVRSGGGRPDARSGPTGSRLCGAIARWRAHHSPQRLQRSPGADLHLGVVVNVPSATAGLAGILRSSPRSEF